jgi:hypothetical protein
MKLLAAFTVPKAQQDPAPNEDADAVSPDGLIAAVSDGASESYDPALWSRTLVDSYVREPRFRAAWVEETIRRYEASAKTQDLPWYAEAAMERGSFATLLGIRHRPKDRTARILAIGDSLAILADGEQFVSSFPYVEPEQFKENPLLLSTRRDRNEWPGKRFNTRKCHTVWHLSALKEPRLLLVTDALGAWVLGDRFNRTQALLHLSSHLEFLKLVETSRESGEMRRDDTTYLMLSEGIVT